MDVRDTSTDNKYGKMALCMNSSNSTITGVQYYNILTISNNFSFSKL